MKIYSIILIILLVIFGVFFFIKEPSKAQEMKIIIAGDVMLDRHNRALGEKYGYDFLFQNIAPLFHSADVGIANLESAVTDYPSQTLLSNGETDDSFTFTSATNTPEALSNAGISLVSLANNHSYNFGADGLLQTHNWLSVANVSWFGSPLNATGTEKIICKNSICIAFVGYNEFSSGIDNILSDVKRLSDEKYPVVVMAHWGDEYATNTPQRVKDEAKEFVDAGATAIIGSHPHVIGDKEWVGNVPVIYSLGNLLFDQYFSTDVMTGNIAEIDFIKENSVTKIDKIFLYTISNISHLGPAPVGHPIEFYSKDD